MLILLIVECALELIPKKIRSHPAVRKNLKERNYASQLLDTALHHSAMKQLKNFQKRGRPDIVHLSLLNALGSALNKSGHLRLFIHTIQNRIFEFNPAIRISRNYRRFKGLMAKLLIDNIIGTPRSPLISPYDVTLKPLCASFEDPVLYLFTSRGKLIDHASELFSNDLSKNYIAVIGGFQKGDFSERVHALSPQTVSVSNYSLDAWVASYRIISYYESIHHII